MNYDELRILYSSFLCPLYPVAVITVEVWITMPRSVACPPSQRNATTARASRTWWLSVPTRRWRPPQALRTNMRLPRPLAQGPGHISVPQRRRGSVPAHLLWRAPPPRSPSHTVASEPTGGRNPEKQPIEVYLSLLTPDPHVSLQSRIPKPPLIYLTPVKKWEVLISLLIFYFFIILTSVVMATINGVQTCECVWLTCSHLVQLWEPPLEWWLQAMTVFLVSISAAQGWNNMVWFFFSCFSCWTYMLAILKKKISMAI